VKSEGVQELRHWGHNSRVYPYSTHIMYNYDNKCEQKTLLWRSAQEPLVRTARLSTSAHFKSVYLRIWTRENVAPRSSTEQAVTSVRPTQAFIKTTDKEQGHCVPLRLLHNHWQVMGPLCCVMALQVLPVNKLLVAHLTNKHSASYIILRSTVVFSGPRFCPVSWPSSVQTISLSLTYVLMLSSQLRLGQVLFSSVFACNRQLRAQYYRQSHVLQCDKA
jgi:hypothetical protein